MHKLIDKSVVENIRSTGKTSSALPDRIPILKKYNLPYDKSAENIIISGCQILQMFPGQLTSLARIFEAKNLSYSFLSKEYCCGNYLYRPAIGQKDDEAIADCRNLSREFVGKNIEQAHQLGAKRIIIFCSPCYPVYRHAFPEENIVFYPAAITEVFESVKFAGKIDYYPGCYRLHKKLSPIPMDLASSDEILEKIEGLEINRIKAPKCCFHPEGLAHMIEEVTTRTMLHICTGCYGQALQNMPPDKGVDVLMLPEFVERIMKIK